MVTRWVGRVSLSIFGLPVVNGFFPLVISFMDCNAMGTTATVMIAERFGRFGNENFWGLTKINNWGVHLETIYYCISELAVSFFLFVCLI